MHEVPYQSVLDIEVPIRGRLHDARSGSVETRSRGRALHAAWDVLPYPVGVLLSAQPGPFGLEVDVKHDDRVVGYWQVECNPHDANGLLVSHVRAGLYVCGSAAGNPRESGAFLAIGSWWVDASDPKRLETLYACLSSEVLDRLASLLGDDTPTPWGEPQPSFVLYLLDVRRRDRRALSLAALESALLRGMAEGHDVPGLDLRVAFGPGIGTPPQIELGGVSATLPMALTSSPEEADPQGPVFVRETVSAANVKWNRRASDRTTPDRPLQPVRDVTDLELTTTSWPRAPRK